MAIPSTSVVGKHFRQGVRAKLVSKETYVGHYRTLLVYTKPKVRDITE